MKHLSTWLAVLLLGAVPLAATAADYGPDRQLLAVENAAPQMPDVQSRSATTGSMARPDYVEANAEGASNASPVPPRMTPSAASPPPASSARGPVASNKPHSSAPAKPALEPAPATWRSLLPGSIQ